MKTVGSSRVTGSAKNYYWSILAAFFAIFMLTQPFMLFPWLTDKGASWFGLDPSWQMLLEYAIMKHLTWGKDIIFTYGPLGFLAMRVGWGISKWVLLFFDLFVVLNYFFVFKDFIVNATDKFLAVLIIFCITLLVNVNLASEIALVLSIFSFYWMYKSYSNPAYSYFFILMLIILLSFYIKLNTGLIGIFLLFIHLLNMLWHKKIKLAKAIIISAILLVAIVVTSFVLHVALTDYIKGSAEIIRGYNDIMYINGGNDSIEHELKIVFTAITFIYIIYTIFLLKRKNYGQLFFAGIGLLYIFILRKQAILRADPQHLSVFIPYAPLVLIYGNLLYNDEKFQKFILRSSLVVVIIAVCLNIQRKPVDAFNTRYSSLGTYSDQFKTSDNLKYLSQKDKRYIPQRILDKISNSTIDVFPWDAEYLLENKLNYTPRPVFQSYAAYTDYLEKANYNFYLKTPPQFVLYDLDAIDDRYAFNDECLVNLFLSKNYVLTDTFTSNERWRFILQKKDKSYPLQFDKIKEENIDITKEIPLYGSSFLKIDLTTKLRGKLESFFLKSPPVRIMFLREDGTWFNYKTSRELLKSGVYIEKFVFTNEYFKQLMYQPDSLPAMKAVKLEIEPRFFSVNAKVEYYKIKK